MKGCQGTVCSQSATFHFILQQKGNVGLSWRLIGDSKN